MSWFLEMGVSYWNAPCVWFPCILQFISAPMSMLFVLNASQGFINALEKVGASLEVLYKFQNFGCLGIYPYYCKLKHESECQYRPYTGPHAGFKFLWIYVMESWYVENASRKCNMTCCLKLQPYRGIDSNLQRRILYHACVAQSVAGEAWEVTMTNDMVVSR